MPYLRNRFTQKSPLWTGIWDLLKLKAIFFLIRDFHGSFERSAARAINVLNFTPGTTSPLRKRKKCLTSSVRSENPFYLKVLKEHVMNYCCVCTTMSTPLL
ncbi:hypothetical protein HN873_017397 [Arachis hypogaea]